MNLQLVAFQVLRSLPRQLLIVMQKKSEILRKFLGTISGIIRWDPSVSKTNRLHVDIFRIFYT